MLSNHYFQDLISLNGIRGKAIFHFDGKIKMHFSLLFIRTLFIKQAKRKYIFYYLESFVGFEMIKRESSPIILNFFFRVFKIFGFYDLSKNLVKSHFF